MALNQMIHNWAEKGDVIVSRSQLRPESVAAITRARELGTAKYWGSNRCIVKASIDGRVTILGCTDLAYPHAEANKFGDFYYCVLHTSLVRTLFWLCVGVWGCSDFLKEIGPPRRDGRKVLPTAIPPGLELVWWAMHLSLDEHPRSPNKVPAWLGETLTNVTGLRRKYLISTFYAAVDYIWLHEMAHVACGHIDLLKDGNWHRQNGVHGANRESSADDSRTSHENRKKQLIEVRRAAEIEADRWAILRLFKACHERGFKYPERDNYGLVVTGLGISLTHIVFYAMQILSEDDGGEHLEFHPPLWFRTDDMLRMEELAAERVFQSGKARNRQRPKSENWQVNRLRQQMLVIRGLLELGNVHPFFGLWLGPTIDNSRQSEAETILKRARKALKRA